jgi:drug/metabolite transporter (DMT)-like permease
MDRQKQAYLYGLATVACWSTVASAFKLSLRHLDPVQLLLYSSLSSLIALGAILAAQGKLPLLRRLTGQDWRKSALYGLLNPFAYYLVLFRSYALLPAQEAQPLNYTWAVTLALLSIPLLGQRLSRTDLAAILVSYSGVFVLATRGDPLAFRFSNPEGAALALGSTVIWALYWILNTKDTRDPVVGLFLNFLFGTAYILPVAAMLSTPLVSDWRGLLGAAYVGVFEMGVTFVLWLKALKLSRTAAQVGNLIYLSPFLSLVLIHFTVGEDILPSTLAGLVLIIAGNVLQQLGRRQTAA